MSAGADPARFKPQTVPSPDARGDMRARMQRNGQWQAHQTAGRHWPVACVSLEITQRCNLDCTLCYLSESSEAVRDFPLEEVYRRIDLIVQHYGAGTDVQVSGGEPTLRRRDELVAIVRRLSVRGLRASLFTNGIKATRDLLVEPTAAGLNDVAFHVDSTQQRAGYASETELNALRREYINCARGLPISVFFNTTVHAGNVDDVANGHAHDAFADAPFVQRFMRETAHLRIDRGTPWRALKSLLAAALARPRLSLAALRWVVALAWRLRTDLFAARGRVHKLTFFTHNFMDACQLDAERIEACVFMAMTQDGPLSMCAYNAQRDHYLLQPLPTSQGPWQPLPEGRADVPTFPIKWLKGRSRAAALQEHRADQRVADTLTQSP